MNQDIIDEGTADGRPIYANEFGKTFIRQQGASTIRICDKEGAVEALKNHDYNNNNNADGRNRSNGGISCFRCGQPGHYASACPNNR